MQQPQPTSTDQEQEPFQDPERAQVPEGMLFQVNPRADMKARARDGPAKRRGRAISLIGTATEFDEIKSLNHDAADGGRGRPDHLVQVLNLLCGTEPIKAASSGASQPCVRPSLLTMPPKLSMQSRAHRSNTSPQTVLRSISRHQTVRVLGPEVSRHSRNHNSQQENFATNFGVNSKTRLSFSRSGRARKASPMRQRRTRRASRQWIQPDSSLRKKAPVTTPDEAAIKESWASEARRDLSAPVHPALPKISCQRVRE